MPGPGAITATVLLAGQAHGNWLLIAVLLAMIAVVSACRVVAFFFAGRISGLLGMTAISCCHAFLAYCSPRWPFNMWSMACVRS